MTTEQLLPQLQSLVLAQKETLTLEECARYTGLSRRTIQNKMSARTIPHYRKEGTPFFDRKQIDTWCKSNPVATGEQIEMKANAYLQNKKSA